MCPKWKRLQSAAKSTAEAARMTPPPESPGAVSLHAFFYVTKTIIIIIRQVIGLSLQKKCIKKKKSEPIPNWDDVRISWVWWSIGDSNS